MLKKLNIEVKNKNVHIIHYLYFVLKTNTIIIIYLIINIYKNKFSKKKVSL